MVWVSPTLVLIWQGLCQRQHHWHGPRRPLMCWGGSEQVGSIWEHPGIPQAEESQAEMGRKALKPREMQRGQRAGLLPARGPGKSTQRMTSHCDN